MKTIYQKGKGMIRGISARFYFYKEKKHEAFLALSMALFFVPFLAFAALPPTLEPFFVKIIVIFNAIIVFLIGLAFVVFLWGVYKYIYSASVEAKESARSLIIYGLIGLFVMLAAWGLVNILLDTFGFTSANTPTNIPKAFRP